MTAKNPQKQGRILEVRIYVYPWKNSLPVLRVANTVAFRKFIYTRVVLRKQIWVPIGYISVYKKNPCASVKERDTFRRNEGRDRI